LVVLIVTSKKIVLLCKSEDSREKLNCTNFFCPSNFCKY